MFNLKFFVCYFFLFLFSQEQAKKVEILNITTAQEISKARDAAEGAKEELAHVKSEVEQLKEAIQRQQAQMQAFLQHGKATQGQTTLGPSPSPVPISGHLDSHCFLFTLLCDESMFQWTSLCPHHH